MRYRLYVLSTALAAMALGALSLLLVPTYWTAGNLLTMSAVAALTGIALIFPLKLSPQTRASMAIAPIFMGVLLLTPFHAAVAVAVGAGAADRWLKRKKSAMAFNMSVAALASLLSGLLLFAVPGSSAALLSPLGLAVALLAGAVLHFTNLLAMATMLSIRKGITFWSIWKKTWLMDIPQEGGALAIGYLGAVLSMQAWWTVPLLIAPLVIVQLGLRRSVKEAMENIELAQKLEAQMKELRATQAQLVQSAKMASIGTLAAGVAHEINNPLFAILGRAELLMQNPDRHLASERAREYVQTMEQMAKRASTIVRELLTFSKPQEAPEVFKVPEAMDLALDLVGKSIAIEGIMVRKEYTGDIPRVRGYNNRLQQVFVNLLQNAKDAMPHGGMIMLRCSYENGMVRASVKDQGTGIPAEYLPRIFEPFFTTKEVGKGTGLGLYVCHRIVTEHQGRILVQSSVGEGTEFIIELPAVEAAVVAMPKVPAIAAK